MKNFLLSLFAVVFFTNFFFAQEVKIVSGKISSGFESVDLPIEIKSDKVYTIQSSEFTKHVRYSEVLKGEVLIVTDTKDKIVAITVSNHYFFRKSKISLEVCKRSLLGH